MHTDVHGESDKQLVNQLEAGSRAAFGKLYERYKICVYAFCFRMLQDRDSAEDAAHETFMKMRSEIASLRSPESLKPWLLRISRNEILMHLRRTRRNGSFAEDVVWDEPNPHDQLVSADTARLVQRLLNNLSQSYREALTLREYEQLSYAEIAEITQSTESSVKSRIFKARRALAEKLKPYLK